MNFKFQITGNDAHAVVDALEQAKAKMTTTKSLDGLHQVITGIKDDISNGVEVFQELRQRLVKYTDGTAITLTTNYKTELGMSSVFIASPNGLISVLNKVLKLVVDEHKPGKEVVPIGQTKITSMSKIQELVALIVTTYAKI